MTKPLSIAYDDATDVLTIDGMRYSGELFRMFASNGLALNEWMAITSRDDGVITLRKMDPALLREAIEIIEGEREVLWYSFKEADGAVHDADAAEELRKWDDWLKRAREAAR